MHIPDGLVTSAPVLVGASTASVGGMAYALRTARKSLDDRQVPVVGLAAAFIFAAQMVNFPIAVGTTGHLIGGVLAAVLLGPWMACLVLGVVLTVQAIGFADGGITVLGANVALMSLVCGVGGYGIFRGLRAVLPRSRRGFLAATAMAAWASVVLASAVCSVFITVGGPFGADALGTVLPIMTGVHALIGVGEAVLTTLVVGAVLTARPDLVAGAALVDRLEPARSPA